MAILNNSSCIIVSNNNLSTMTKCSLNINLSRNREEMETSNSRTHLKPTVFMVILFPSKLEFGHIQGAFRIKAFGGPIEYIYEKTKTITCEELHQQSRSQKFYQLFFIALWFNCWVIKHISGKVYKIVIINIIITAFSHQISGQLQRTAVRLHERIE